VQSSRKKLTDVAAKNLQLVVMAIDALHVRFWLWIATGGMVISYFYFQSQQNKKWPDVIQAVILSTPLWATGWMLLAVIFLTGDIAPWEGPLFVALSFLNIVLATMAALRVMAGNLRRSKTD